MHLSLLIGKPCIFADKVRFPVEPAFEDIILIEKYPLWGDLGIWNVKEQPSSMEPFVNFCYMQHCFQPNYKALFHGTILEE